MKKLTTIAAIFITWIFLAWCTKTKFSHSSNPITWEIIIDSWNTTTSISWNTEVIASGDNDSLNYLSWYTWNTVIITETNKDQIITQITDSLLYKNEVYGFQISLTKKAKWVKIKDRILLQSGDNGTTIKSHYISFYWDNHGWAWQDNYDENFSISHKYPNFQRVIDIEIMDYEKYNTIPDNWRMWWWKKLLKELTLWSNNKYYFVWMIGSNASHDYLAQLIPTLTCKDIVVQTTKWKDCWNWINQLITWFKTFHAE